MEIKFGDKMYIKWNVWETQIHKNLFQTKD